MNNNPLISIIIPHYNTPALLKRLLDSIGFHEDVQIIVIDDNSTKDISLYQAVQKEYQSDHTIFLKNDSGKKGAGAARNIGLERKLLLHARYRPRAITTRTAPMPQNLFQTSAIR